MKSSQRGRRRLAGLRKQLRRLRLAYARGLAHRVKGSGSLPVRILALKERLSKVREQLRRRFEAA